MQKDVLCYALTHRALPMKLGDPKYLAVFQSQNSQSSNTQLGSFEELTNVLWKDSPLPFWHSVIDPSYWRLELRYTARKEVYATRCIRKRFARVPETYGRDATL